MDEKWKSFQLLIGAAILQFTMSVIIRLQNLPWSANALDIRNFFRGLSIPEGGVHIVGGELGDAFIAFRAIFHTTPLAAATARRVLTPAVRELSLTVAGYILRSVPHFFTSSSDPGQTLGEKWPKNKCGYA
ncbi:hypothetical protein EVAR_27536_1 [Eumeta japonica]|uniref:Uncharacterized protein n=1 Tax=Eumeta variegata TaxID=151549 RepID=A0A4C1W3D8_EUMVA|nr:hypothetical protein EVAR_27536_1 [Eumeta japonica]